MILEVLKKYLGKLVANTGGTVLQFMEVEMLSLLRAVGNAADKELKLRNEPVVVDTVNAANDVVADKVVRLVDKISSKDDE